MSKVSIIVPIYNKEKYISKTISSVLNQTYNNFELLLINDGSTDKSEDIILKFVKEDSRIKYIKQENQGVSAARNKGIDAAKGDYISFLDADDLYHKRFVELMLREIENKNVCYCGSYVIKNNRVKKVKNNFITGNILRDYLLGRCNPNMNSWMINKRFLKKNNIRFIEDQKWGEDMSFFSKLTFHDHQVTCVNEYLTYYHLDVDGSLSENNIEKVFEEIEWLTEIKSYVIKNSFNKYDYSGVIQAIDTYRIPAFLIQRLYVNKNIVETEKYNRIKKEVMVYIDKFKLNNGKKSIKAWLYKIKI
ncbi:glycosyltransferase family 2 protein [Bacillus sp. PAMC26568]|nr:glycosyltransferase family 2 protein [Bacillus sp. PAMC26568]